MRARVSLFLKSRAWSDMLSFSLCNKKTYNSAQEQTPLSNDTIASVLRHREVGRLKDSSATPLIFNFYVGALDSSVFDMILSVM